MDFFDFCRFNGLKVISDVPIKFKLVKGQKRDKNIQNNSN